jgi:glycosyltransferase involved in cell wall biosynthesis
MTVTVVVETVTVREDTSTGSLADGLRATLAGLARQTLAPDEIIIVIDDLVDEGAAEELRRRYPYAKLATSASQSNYFAAKNAGVAAASGSIVAMLDGDCQPAPDWLELLVARLIPGVDGVAGRTRYIGGSLAARTFSIPDFAYVLEQEAGTATGMNINNVAFRREVLLQHPFDPRIRRNGGCYLLFNQLRAAGACVVYERRARTAHGHLGAFALLKKHFDRGYDGVTVYRLDEQGVLRGSRIFRRLGGIALVGIVGRRIVLDWIRLTRQRRQIGIPLIALPYYGAVTVATRLLELAGGFVAIADPRRYTRTAAN